jgi:hypothetical protein
MVRTPTVWRRQEADATGNPSVALRSVLAKVDGDTAVFVVEDGDEFKPGSECFEVLAEGRDADVVGVLELRDGGLGDVEALGEFDLTDFLGATEFEELDLFKSLGAELGGAFGVAGAAFDVASDV